MSRFRNAIVIGAMCVVFMSLAAAPAEAQREYNPLFDKFNFQVEASWINLSTEIRLHSEILGTGTTIDFENLGLAADKTIPTLAFQWQIAKRHRVGVRWQDIDRSSTTHVEDEIHWGDEIIPVDATLGLDVGITQTFIDYAFYPWVKERWAAGFGLCPLDRPLDDVCVGWCERRGRRRARPPRPARCRTSTSNIDACFPKTGASWQVSAGSASRSGTSTGTSGSPTRVSST